MGLGSSPARQALRRAQAAAACARQTGCDIAEAADILASREASSAAGESGLAGGDSGVSRRQLLGGAAAAGLAVAVPFGASSRPPAARSSRSVPRVVIIGSGIAGLGCALRLWTRHGIRSEVFEYNASRPGGRIHTLRGFFDDGQYAEEHGEFISSEHTEMRRLAARFGLILDDVNIYPAHTHARDYRFRFDGHFWPQATLDREWHEWGWRLFYEAAFVKAPWPTLYNKHTPSAWKWDHMSAAEWIDENVRGGLDGDFGRLCVSVLLDEYGGPVAEQSALNLIYLLGLYDSAVSGRQPTHRPQLSGTNEKWHIRGGNDLLITELISRLPAGTVHLGERLEAVISRGHGGYTCVLASGRAAREVRADHVVLALPFTKLREVELSGIDLPPRQRSAIREEPLGSNSKIQMQFSSRIWNADHWTGNAYNDEILQGSWEATIGQPGTSGILIALPGGEQGADIGRRYGLTGYEGPAPAGMVSDFLDGFNVMFPGTRGAYAGKTYYAWSCGDPHIGGAYSYLKTGQYTGFNGIQARRRGNIHFAGEHTSVNFQGYMEGGLRSGYRCAAEITGR